MAGFLSSVNLNAGAGILGNIGGYPIGANTTAINNISTFNSLSVESQFSVVKNSGNLVLASGTMSSLNNLANDIFAPVTNSVPSSYIGTLGSTPLDGLTGLLSIEISNIMGGGDIGQFDQVLSIASGYVAVTNLLINSSNNANDAASNATYSSQDNTLTGSLSQVTQAFAAFGEDLISLGNAIDLDQLPNIGSPQALLRQIYTSTHGSTELTTALAQAGIGQDILNNLGEINMTDEQQKIAFDVMSNIKGYALSQVLRLLQVTNNKFNNLAELLNPVKAFPRSFVTLTAPTADGLRGIYIDANGTINSNVETQLPASVLAPLQGYQTVKNTYSQLKKIIPSDWALANEALEAGLQQVKAVFNTTLQKLGAAALELESNKGLNLINSLTSPLPADVSAFYSQTYASGTGTNGTFLLADVIGSAGGWVVNNDLPIVNSVLANLIAANALTTLTSNTTGVFTVMQNTINGNYGDPSLGPVVIPGGLPGAGTYTNGDDAFNTGLIPAAYSLIGNIVANNTSSVTTANSSWANIAAQLATEKATQAAAELVFANLIPNTSATSLVTSLPTYGLDTTEGGAAWFLESVADTGTQGGQAIISTMRGARNQVRLEAAGAQTDITVSDVGIEPQANIVSAGQYTVAEAASQKII